MRYKFNEFEFNSTHLLLTKNGEVLAIRHTEAKVLAVLLEKIDTVLSKEDILSHVWANKVVSEQVVFQNISNLRSLFGNEAIKTFPKRGYQWQLNTEVISLETENTPGNQHSQNALGSSQQPHRSIQAKKRSFWQSAVLYCIFFITVGLFYSQSEFMQDKPDSKTKLAYIPMTNLDDKTSNIDENITHEGIAFEDNTDFEFTELLHLNTELFEDAIEIEYPKLSNIHPFILSGKLRTYKQKTYLDFMLKGPASNWKGHLSGSSKKDVIEQLQQHLKQQVIYDLTNKLQPAEVRQAKLSIAHQVSPNDPIILRKLSMSYIDTDELEKAMVMADKLINLAKSQNNTQHMGIALLYQAKLLSIKKLYNLSSIKLKLAIEQFEKIDDLRHQARAWYSQYWLYHQQGNYLAVKASLLKSAQFSYDAKDKLSEIQALSNLSLMAHNYQEDNDKYLYLQQAESKINAYQLPVYHYALISFRYANFAKTLSDKEPHLKQVLKYTALTPDHWTAQLSRRQLVQHYLMQNRLDEGQSLIESISSDNYHNSYLKTLMAQAKQQTNEMISHAQRTFEQAQLAGGRSVSLDIALLLCEQQVNYDFYSQYIKDNATVSWLSVNETKLLALNP